MVLASFDYKDGGIGVRSQASRYDETRQSSADDHEIVLSVHVVVVRSW